jgi:hypothetical protein
MYHEKLLRALTVKRIRQIERCTKTFWEVGEKAHREDGPAIVCEHGVFWMINGCHHRVDAPAVISYKRNIVTKEEWWIHDRKHRHELPAVTTYNRNNRLQEWWFYGMRHRGKVDGEQLPAVIDTGTDKFPEGVMIYYWHGLLHRKAAPAYITGNIDNPTQVQWYKNGRRHHPESNPDAMENPAICGEYRQFGFIQEWWYDGDLQLAIVKGVYLLPDGNDVFVSNVDFKPHRNDKPVVKAYIVQLVKQIKIMTELKDKQRLEALKKKK